MKTKEVDQDVLLAAPSTIDAVEELTRYGHSNDIHYEVLVDSTLSHIRSNSECLPITEQAEASSGDDNLNHSWHATQSESTLSETSAGNGFPASTIDTIPHVPDGDPQPSACGAQDIERFFLWNLGATWFRLGETTAMALATSSLHSAASHAEVVPGFEILSVLGRGGMGIVYKARQLRLNRLVALKMIRDDRHINHENIARFEIEAEAVARLNHPNILRIYQIGRAGDVPFVALELLEGGTLADRLAATPQPMRESALLVSTLARAVNAAHVAGIMHRDIKPSNVLFDHDGIPKIADFGLAKRLDVEEGETQTGQVMGTPSYMAPEQAKGWDREIGPAADIYSLGAILYEMLTGRPPLKGTTPTETLKLLLDEEPVQPSRLRPKIPFDLETICLKCIARDPRKRYSSALGLAEDLDRYLAGQPIRARRTPFPERFIKLARRRPGTTLLLAVGILATGISAAAIWRAQKLEDLKRAQNEQRVSRALQGCIDDILSAQGALTERRWDDARETLLSGLLSRTDSKSDQRFAALRATAVTLYNQARAGDANDKAKEAEQKAREEARTRFRRFVDARDEALFLDARFGIFNASSAIEATCKAARAGLGVFGHGAQGDEWTLPALPAALSPGEQEEVVRGFYHLLLVLADAISESQGADPKQRAEQALRIVDRAVELRSSATKAYHLRRSAYLEMKRDRQGAARERNEAERLAPVDAFDFFLVGRELTKRSEWAAAISQFEAATQRQPDHFWSQCWLAICHLQIQEPSKARLCLNACLPRKPDSVWLYLLRGVANAGAGKVARDLAGRYPDQATSLSAAASAQFEAAEADYRKALTLLGVGTENTELHYILRVNRGVIRLERGNLASAADDLQEAIRLDGNRFEAYSALAKVYERQARPYDALEQFARAIQLRPNWPPLYRARAELLLALKLLSPERRDAALSDLEAAIRYESPGSPKVALDRTKQAEVLHQAHRDEDGLKACDAALELSPRHAAAHLLRARILLDLKRYDDLIRSCDVALGSGKPSAELYALRGVAKDARKDHPGAVTDYTLALALQAGNPRLHRRRGWSYLAQDASRPAATDFDEAIHLDPTNADAYSGRGFARACLGHHSEAVSDAEEAMRRGESSWRIAYNSARIYARASTAAGSEARQTGPDAVHLVSRYQESALAHIRVALQRATLANRSALLSKLVATDPAFQPIRRRLRWIEGLRLEPQ